MFFLQRKMAEHRTEDVNKKWKWRLDIRRGDKTKHDESDEVTETRSNSRNNIVRVPAVFVAINDESAHE